MIKIEDLEDEIKSKELNFTQKLSESEESCTDLKKQLKKIEIKMKGQEKKSICLWKRIDDLKLENEDLKQKLETKVGKLEEPKLDLVTQEKEVNDNNESEIKSDPIAFNNNDLNDAGEKIKDLKQQIEELKGNNQKLKDDELDFGIKIASLEQTILSRESNIELLENQIKSLDKIIMEKDQKNEDYELVIQKLKSDIAEGLLAPRKSVFHRERMSVRTTQHKNHVVLDQAQDTSQVNHENNYEILESIIMKDESDIGRQSHRQSLGFVTGNV